MEKGFSSGSQAIGIVDTMKTIRDMAMVRCTGMMAVFTKADGSKACNTARVFFRCQMEGSKREFFRKISLLRKKL